MDASLLDYNLPPERIARFPAERRDESRLLVYDRAGGEIVHAKFRDLPELLPRPFDFFRNNAAVLRGRLFCKKRGGGDVECLLIEPCGEANEWLCLLRPGRRLPVGAEFGRDGYFNASVSAKFDDGTARVRFCTESGESVISLSQRIGVVPLPPYIARDQKSPDYDRNFDNERYETVYADSSKRVAAAAPTAGLHFTKDLEQKLKIAGNAFYELTLHVGIGTFKPLKGERVEEHQMHSETYEIPRETLRALAESKRPRMAVGTTSLRAMEDYMRKHPSVDPSSDFVGSAKLFIYPPQRIISADALITNFHLPRSTLMCLVSSFIKAGSTEGIDILKHLYAVAIEKKYNFYSYGDAMLIL